MIIDIFISTLMPTIDAADYYFIDYDFHWLFSLIFRWCCHADTLCHMLMPLMPLMPLFSWYTLLIWWLFSRAAADAWCAMPPDMPRRHIFRCYAIVDIDDAIDDACAMPCPLYVMIRVMLPVFRYAARHAVYYALCFRFFFSPLRAMRVSDAQQRAMMSISFAADANITSRIVFAIIIDITISHITPVIFFDNILRFDIIIGCI